MRKIISVTLAVCLLLSVMSVFAANTEIIIDGQKATIAPGMGTIYNKDSRTFVPVRFLLEYFKFGVSWEDETQTVFGINEAGESFMMQIGNKTLFYFDANGNQKDLPQMDTAPFLNTDEDRTYVPLRFIADAIGYKVDWDGKTETVTLVKK